MKVFVVTKKWSSERTMRDYSEVYGVYSTKDGALNAFEEIQKSSCEELDYDSWLDDITIDECEVI